MTSRTCPEETALSDAEIAAIVRDSAGSDRIASQIHMLGLDAICRLPVNHGSRHASWQASVTDPLDPERAITAWYRWDGNGGEIDWLHKACGHRHQEGSCPFGESGPGPDTAQRGAARAREALGLTRPEAS